VIAALEASGASAVVDEDFGRDVEEGIKAHREPRKRRQPRLTWSAFWSTNRL
jgi:hypothetical protein